MEFRRFGAIALVAASMSGCLVPAGLFDMPDSTWDGGFHPGSELQQARIEGEVGRFSANVSSGYGWADVWDHGMFLDVRGEGNGIVMAMIDLSNIDVRSLKVGDRFHGGMQMDGDGAWSEDQPWLMMQGCGGVVDDVWEEDYPAEDVDVEVTDAGEGTITLEFHATLETARGRFAVARRASASSSTEPPLRAMERAISVMSALRASSRAASTGASMRSSHWRGRMPRRHTTPSRSKAAISSTVTGRGGSSQDTSGPSLVPV